MAVLLTTVAALSGLVYQSPYAPAMVGGVLAATAGVVACWRRPVWALYAALFVVMLPVGLLPVTVQSHLNRGLTVMAFGMWLVSVLVRRQPVTVTIATSLMSAFLLWGLLTLLWAEDPSVGFNAVQMYALRLVLYLFLVANLVRTEADLDGLMKVLAISGWALVVAGLATLAAGGYTPGSRFQILEMNENETGVLALITMPGVLWLAIRSSGRQKAINTVLSYVFVGVALALVAMTGSRGSAISWAITLAAFWFWRCTRPWARLGLVLLVAAIVIMPLMFSTLSARFTLEAGDTALGGREAIWRAASQLIRENLWSGVGLGGEGYAVMPYLRVLRSASGYEVTSIHNPVLAIWAGTGLPGILLYLSVLASATWLFVAQYRRCRRKGESCLDPYFALITAVFAGYMASWIKGGGIENDFSYYLLLALLVIPSHLQISKAGERLSPAMGIGGP